MFIALMAATQIDPDLAPASVNAEFERFRKAFLEANRLEPRREELNALRAKSPPGRAGNAKREERISDWFTYSLAANYKFHRELHRKHGGRVVLSAFGFHVAADAMIAEWTEWERAGRWRFPSEQVKAAALQHLRTMRGDGVVEGERAREALAHPVWEPAAR